MDTSKTPVAERRHLIADLRWVGNLLECGAQIAPESRADAAAVVRLAAEVLAERERQDAEVSQRYQRGLDAHFPTERKPTCPGMGLLDGLLGSLHEAELRRAKP